MSLKDGVNVVEIDTISVSLTTKRQSIFLVQKRIAPNTINGGGNSYGNNKKDF